MKHYVFIAFTKQLIIVFNNIEFGGCLLHSRAIFTEKNAITETGRIVKVY